MNSALTRIASLSQKPRIIIGLMSGTSLDGLDIAVCNVSGHDLTTSLVIKYFTSIRYSAEFLAIVRPIFANPKAALSCVAHANAWLAREHAAIVKGALEKWNIECSDVDILASHGQTIFHAPNSFTVKDKNSTPASEQHVSATMQIGDGDHLAFLTQILTVSDFRQKHIAASGEGAPLVPYADYLLFSSKTESRILINIGGIANFTYLPINGDFNSVISADSGPGNTLMDTVIQSTHALSDSGNLQNFLPKMHTMYDENGGFATKGIIDCQLLDIMMTQVIEKQKHADLSGQINQSTGQETYNIDFVYQALEQRMQETGGQLKQSPLFSYLTQSEQAFYDLIATLNLFTAKTISAAIENLPLGDNKANTTIYVSGGGVHNPVLLANITKCMTQMKIKRCEDLGIAADAKEAALFAVLANQTLFGDNKVFANEHGIPATAFGKISLP